MYKISLIFSLMFLAGPFATQAEEVTVPVIPKGDIIKGEKIFKKCIACHTVTKDGKNKVGPNLWGIVGKGIAENDIFNYSKAYKAKKGEVVWSEDVLFDYLKKPRTYIKGTKMAFAGLKKEQDRADVIAYLKTLADKAEE